MEEVCFDIETTGLDPFSSRITAIATSNGFGTDAIVDKDEKFILEKFWEGVKRKYPFIRLVGFNCQGFDMPFLIIRSLKHNIRVSDLNGKIIDLREVLSNGNKYQKGKLDDYAKLIGIGQKYKGYSGFEAIRLWNENKLEELKEYVLNDVEMTHNLYKRMKETGIVR